MKTAVVQVVIGAILLVAVTFFASVILPDLLHVELPPDENGRICHIEINGGYVLPMWIAVMYILGLAVLVNGIFQMIAGKRLS